MISNWIFVIVMILLAILAYFIGLTRGISGSQHLYDDGWLAAEEYFKRFPELTQDIDKMMDDLYEEYKQDKYEKAREMIKELDDLFEDECPVPEEAFSDPSKDDNVIDGGWY